MAYELEVYKQGVRAIIHNGPSRNIEAYHHNNGREGGSTPDMYTAVTILC